MPNPARENRIASAVLLELRKIGTPPSAWLTTPTVAIGLPPDALPTGVKQQIYLSPFTTDMQSEDDQLTGAGPEAHQARLELAIWYVSGKADGLTDVWNLVADGRRALWAAEGALETATDGGGVWVDQAKLHLKMSRAGFIVVLQLIHATAQIAHTDP